VQIAKLPTAARDELSPIWLTKFVDFPAGAIGRGYIAGCFQFC
jgi:hypothetical protein